MAKAVRTFGPFQLERELGRGSNGVVFLATRAGHDERYALKVNTGPTDREAQIRLQLEAQVTSRLQHPGIVRVVDQGVHEGREYLLMEFCEGESLQQRLSRGPLGWREATEIVQELARIMAVAHAEGVVHRDLKPANVMLEAPNGQPRIIDFGLARDPSLVRSLTQSHVMLGTPITMAPEQIVGEDVDARTDVYALGAIFYICLTGRPPLRGADLAELGRLICTVEPEPPRHLASGLPAPIERVCLDALAKPKDWRPADAGALAARLDEALAAVDAGEPSAPPASPRGAPPWGAVAVGGMALGLAIGLGAWLLSGDASAPSEPSPPPASESNRAAEVERHFERFLERARARAPLDDLLPIFNDAEEAAAGDVDLLNRVRLERADAYRRRGDYQNCIDAAPVEVEGYVGYAARFLKGLSELRLGRNPESEATFRALARDDPQGSRGLHAQAVLMIFDGGPWGEYMQKSRDADPTDVQAQLGAAYGLSKIEGPEASLAAIEAISQREPDEPHAYFERAFVLGGLGDFEGSLAAYAEVLEITFPFASHQALMGRARALVELERPREALEECERLLVIDPDYLLAEIFRGFCLWVLGDKQQAELIWRGACERRDPETWHYVLGRVPRGLDDRLREIVEELERR